MLKEAIEKILEIGEEPLVAVGEREYSIRPLHPIREPLCDPLEIHTLSGLVDWIDDGGELTPKLVHICDEGLVMARGPVLEQWSQREVLVKCSMFEARKFKFGTFMTIESFIIGVQSMFVATPTLANLISSVSKICTETVIDANDDGITQAVVQKEIAGRLADRKVDPIMNLAPYRTFREAIQPESKFLLRIQKSDGLPKVALFEADGGAWRNEAIANIASYLKENGVKVRIIA